MKFSSETTQPNDKEGNEAQRVARLNREEPSRLKFNSNRYLLA